MLFSLVPRLKFPIFRAFDDLMVSREVLSPGYKGTGWFHAHDRPRGQSPSRAGRSGPLTRSLRQPETIRAHWMPSR